MKLIKKKKLTENIFNNLFVVFVLVLIVSLLFLPSGFEKDKILNSIKVKGEILDVDNSNILQLGIVKTGEQNLKVKILKGKYKNKIFPAVNHMIGKMEFDKIFEVGDKVLIVLTINLSDNNIIEASVIDHYRISIEFILLLLFIVLLIVFARWTGLKAIISFIFTAVAIWKLLLPGFLHGYNPILLSLIIVIILSSIIIFLIGGLTKKGVVAFLGATTGVIMTAVLAIVFGKLFSIHGAVKPFAETLLYSGYAHLNLTQIFIAGIFIASSGAVMDIAMDISASQNEVVKKHPDIGEKELISSGFSVGKAVVGTMITTLLLAYSGGFTALLMVFMAQGTPMINILTINYVAAEILHILVGSFGLVLVAPFTAIIGGFIFVKLQNNKKPKKK
ncbi:MAG: YibE/F family protein [Bacteroidales bacterium]|nr:YibE/F family protein [Bacteroidales bacterium]